jgi:hypothetical protein
LASTHPTEVDPTVVAAGEDAGARRLPRDVVGEAGHEPVEVAPAERLDGFPDDRDVRLAGHGDSSRGPAGPAFVGLPT